MRAIRGYALALLVVATAACGSDPNRLYGSADEIYDLSFDSVAVSKVSTYLVIEYLRGTAKVLKCTVDLAGLTVSPGQPIDLLEQVANAPRGTLQRIVESTVEIPIQFGTLTLDGVPAGGVELTGRFRTTLPSVTGGAAGRTLNGDFEAVVVQK
jgi:hypothetical protein